MRARFTHAVKWVALQVLIGFLAALGAYLFVAAFGLPPFS
jgi:hypothetical protein